MVAGLHSVQQLRLLLVQALGLVTQVQQCLQAKRLFDDAV